MTYIEQTSAKSTLTPSFWQSLWASLTRYHPNIKPEDKSRTRLSIILTVIILTALVIPTVIPLLIALLSGNPVQLPPTPILVAIILYGVAYALNRTKWNMLGITFTVASPNAIIFVAIWESYPQAPPGLILYFFVFTVLIAGLVSGGFLSPVKDTVLATVATVLTIFMLMFIVPGWEFVTVIFPIIFNGSIGALLVAEISLRTQSEKLVEEKIAELEAADKALRAANNSLEERVAERTRELEIALQQREEADRLKDEFMATMSHELRTPLNAIIGFSGIMLMMGDLDDTKTDRMKRIRSNADRLLNLINDILDISRIESGRLETLAIDIHLSDFIGRITEQTHILAEEKNLDVTIQHDNVMPETVRLDEDLLTKITTNLISNTIKFTQEGTISVSVKSVDDDIWRLTVSDTGIGIPAHMHDTIFERFRQVDGTSKRAYGGTGLGLAIVKKMTEAMNGKIWVRSEIGKGSTFTVELPKTLQAGATSNE